MTDSIHSAVAARIANLKKEVSDLHPLLAALLPRLPNLERVDYTHGNDEMGADFVLTSRNPSLGTARYIGVVAKMGKIHQDYGDVERQIEECQVSRYVENGKKSVHLSEVWVVATGNITAAAKRKIHAKYSAQSIDFVSGSELADLVVSYLPNWAMDLPPALAAYLADSRSFLLANDRAAEIVPLADDSLPPLYIEPEVHRLELEPYAQSGAPRLVRGSAVDLLQEVEAHGCVVVEARMGGGKSKALRQLALTCLAPEVFAKRGVLPLVVTYRDVREEYDSTLATAVRANIPAGALDQLEDGRLLLLVDGVDEKNESAENLCEHLVALSEEAKREGWLLIFAMRPMVSAGADVALARKMKRCEIKPLSPQRLLKFLAELCARLHLEKRIVSDVQRSPLFKRLPRTPLAISLLGQVLKESRQELPSSLPELYSKYTELTLGRWDIEKGLQSQQEYEALESVLGDLAAFVLENELNEFSKSEALQRARDYLSQRQLRVDAERLVDLAINRSDILSVDSSGYKIRFRHRSFAEFLYAKRLDQNAALVKVERAFDLYWTNAYFFFLGIRRDAPQILQQLIDCPAESVEMRWAKATCLGRFLMAAYLTPYHVIQSGVLEGVRQAGRLYHDIVSGRVKVAVAELPQMHVLYFFQRAMRDSYGFEFLAAALSGSASDLTENLVEIDEDAASMFFLAVCALDAGVGGAMADCIGLFQGEMPIDVTLAFNHESESCRTGSKLLKRWDRDLRRRLRADAGLRARAERMYKVPLDRQLQ